MNKIAILTEIIRAEIREILKSRKKKANEDCNCGCNDCKEKHAMTLLQPTPVSNGLQYHLENKVPLTENVYRTYSEAYFKLINEVRILHKQGIIQLCEEDQELIKLDVGLTAVNEYGDEVWLDLPVLEENEFLLEVKAKKKNPPLNKPKRGGSKKFYVYVKGKNGRVKKVSFGDTTGLSAKINNPAARRAFAARHDCKNKKDKTKASYWSCRLPRYAKLLGLKSNFGGFW